MSSALIPLQGQQPTFTSPITNLSQLLQAKDLASQIQMRQAQAGDIDAQREQRNKDLQDQNIVQEAMKDPAITAKFAVGDFSPIHGKVQPNTIASLQKSQSEALAAQQTRTEQQRKIHSDALKSINETVSGLLQLTDKNGQPDMNQINARLPSAIQNLSAAGAFKDANLDASQIPQSVGSVEALKGFLAASNGLTALIDHSLTQNKTAAEATEALGKGRQASAEGALKENEVKAIENETPQSAATKVAGIVDPRTPRYAQYLSQYLSAPTIEAKTAVLHQAQQEQGEVAKETNPAIRAAHVQQAVDTERATTGMKVDQAVKTAKALREGDNPAVAGVPPAAVAAVQNHAIKLDEDYLKAKSATDALGHILDLAESGNKAAGSNLPLVGVETLNAINGIKRINSAEINQYGNAGSLLDEIKGKIGKLTSGQPVPQDVLNDIRQLHQQLGQQSFQTYSDSLKSLNDRTGAKYAPAADAPDIRKSSAKAVTPQIQAVFKDAAPGIHKLSDGTTWKKDKDGTITPQ